jgi:hypothetical protein
MPLLISLASHSGGRPSKPLWLQRCQKLNRDRCRHHQQQQQQQQQQHTTTPARINRHVHPPLETRCLPYRHVEALGAAGLQLSFKTLVRLEPAPQVSRKVPNHHTHTTHTSSTHITRTSRTRHWQQQLDLRTQLRRQVVELALGCKLYTCDV